MRGLSRAAQQAALVGGVLVLVVPAALACCADVAEARAPSCCVSVSADAAARSCCEGEETATTLRPGSRVEPPLLAVSPQPAAVDADRRARPGGEAWRASPPPGSGLSARHSVMLL